LEITCVYTDFDLTSGMKASSFPTVAAQAVASASSDLTTQEVGEQHTDLWAAAYTKLREEKRSLVADYEDIMAQAMGGSLSGLELMSDVVAKKLEEFKRSQWMLRWRGKPLNVREKVEQVVKVVSVFRDLGTSTAALDPIHAGLPWAGICALLTVSIMVLLHRLHPCLIINMDSSSYIRLKVLGLTFAVFALFLVMLSRSSTNIII
jgi:hypothetical protein